MLVSACGRAGQAQRAAEVVERLMPQVGCVWWGVEGCGVVWRGVGGVVVGCGAAGRLAGSFSLGVVRRMWRSRQGVVRRAARCMCEGGLCAVPPTAPGPHMPTTACTDTRDRGACPAPTHAPRRPTLPTSSHPPTSRPPAVLSSCPHPLLRCPQAGVAPELPVWNAVLGAYGRAGSVDAAYAAWVQMLESGEVEVGRWAGLRLESAVDGGGWRSGVSL